MIFMTKQIRHIRRTASGIAVLLCGIFGLLLFGPVTAAEVPATGENSVSIPILMYHALLRDNSRQNAYVISPDLFESDLRYLKEHGYTCVVMQDLLDYVHSGKDLPEKPVMLTFDDGYYNNYVYAFPLLEKYNAKIVISPIASMTEKYSQSGEKNPYYSHITWEMIREMVDSGRVEIQNHSYNLHTNTWKRHGASKNPSESTEAYARVLEEDLLRAQRLFSEYADVNPTTFTFPFGAYSQVSTQILRDLGFSATLTCESRMNTVVFGDPDSLFGLGRFRRKNYVSSEDFFANKLKLK